MRNSVSARESKKLTVSTCAYVSVHVRTPLVILCGPIGEQTVQTQPVRIALLVYSLHSQHSQLTLSLSSLPLPLDMRASCDPFPEFHLSTKRKELGGTLRSVVGEVLQLHQLFVRLIIK